MDRLRVIGPAAVLVFGFGAHAAAQQPTMMARRVALSHETHATVVTGSIHGVVLDDRGRPVPGALVSALGPTTTAVETDGNGQFRLNGLPPDAYVVRAHRLGFAASQQLVLRVRAGTVTASSLILRHLRRQFAGAGSALNRLLVPAALVTEAEAAMLEQPGNAEPLLPPLEDEFESVEPIVDPDDHGHEELSWRLRHMKRTVLRDATLGVPGAEPPAARSNSPYASALFGDSPISGQFNFLTVSSFDGPGDLLGEELPRGITYVSLGAPTGGDGRWSVRGALTQGDVSSWFVGGTFRDEIADVHDVDVAMSYATQRYTGGNAAALSALADGSRNVGALSGQDRWAVSSRTTVTYGAEYANYDYLATSHLVSPRGGVAVDVGARTQVVANVSQLMLAPGAGEFLPPPMDGIWLPPERTFSPLVARATLRPERTRHTEIGVQHAIAPGYVVGVRRFRQTVDDQMATMFDVHVDGQERQNLGHYYVASPGNVSVEGWTVSLTGAVADRLRGTVDYTVSRARWIASPEISTIGLTAASAVRPGQERLHDVITSIETEIPETATRLFIFYRFNTAFAQTDPRNLTSGFNSRFDVRVHQGLPFVRFMSVDWELLLAVRNLFHEPMAGGSMYDELLTVRPPKRIVGGVTVRF